MGEWKQRWETCRYKLREIKPKPEIWINSGKYSRRDEVIISRMRLGLTLLTYGYLVNNDVPDVAPHCELWNNASLCVKHMECEQLMEARRACLEVYKRNREPNVGKLLKRNIRIGEMIKNLRNIGAYGLILILRSLDTLENID